VANILERLFGTSRNLPGRTLGGFIDSLLQSFENRRVGLSDATAGAGGAALERYFLEVYEAEAPRLREIVQHQELALGDGDREAFYAQVDSLVRKVVVPAYARAAGAFTLRERNDFYATREALHGAERLGWAAAGILLGGFVIWAPFIPIWSKEWVLPFAVGGLMFPGIRRWLALRRYQSDLNQVLGRADAEVWRMEMAYLTGEGLTSRRRGIGTGLEEASPEADPEQEAAPQQPNATRKTLKQGGR
jgi:hypothetical protein